MRILILSSLFANNIANGEQRVLEELQQQFEIVLISNALKLARKNFQNILNQFPQEKKGIQMLKERIGEQYDMYYPHVYLVDSGNQLIYMELMNYDLLSYVVSQNGLSEEIAKHFFRQIFQAIGQLHSNHIIHGDVKLENILMLVQNIGQDDQHSTIKLCDLGHCTAVHNDNIQGLRGTKRYVEPTLFQALQFQQNYTYNGYKFDIFALGISLFETLICGEFHSIFLNNINNVGAFWERLGRHYPKTRDWSNELKQLFVKMVHPDENGRWNINEILNSQWLKEDEQQQELMDIETNINHTIQDQNHLKTLETDDRDGHPSTEQQLFNARSHLLETIKDHSLENLISLETKREADSIQSNAIRAGSFKSELYPLEILIILLQEGNKVASNWDKEGYLDDHKFVLNAIFEYQEQQIKPHENDDNSDDDEEQKQDEQDTVQKTIQFQIKIWQIKQQEKVEYQSMVEFINTNKEQNDEFKFRKHTNYILTLIKKY